jgi:hypothetical protein
LRLTACLLRETTSLHILEYLTPLLLKSPLLALQSGLSRVGGGSASIVRAPPTPTPIQPLGFAESLEEVLLQPAFTWSPPDLREGQAFYNARVRSLTHASQSFLNPDEVFQDGLEILSIHRGNYMATHPRPQRLQIIWWEFPPEHWVDLKDGSSMNFLKTPRETILPNSDMTPEQAFIAGEFVDELVTLGVVEAATPEKPMVANAPLFTLPKEGQPGQWRVLADMKFGRQNECIGSDPTVFPRSDVILSHLHSGGYSAVVDCSKFFYQFKTRPDERKYLEIVHPLTNVRYRYVGMPMGSAASPSIAGRYGNAFLRKLCYECAAFQGRPVSNTWWQAFQGRQPFDPKRCHGRFLMGDDGLPAVQVWAHCDDFLLHGPTLEKTQRALTQFLDKSVETGMLCHPGKLVPPVHVVKYTGLIFDTTQEPTLRIPVGKRERCLAMVDHPIHRTRPLSRRALAVAVGVLESVVDATPARLGHTFLRILYDTLHPVGLDETPYNTSTLLTTTNRLDLEWCLATLLADASWRCRAPNSGTLLPTVGDGSGTGTGGTIQYPDEPMKMWMGAWSPRVWHFSSNWKELRTLLATLQHAEQDHRPILGSMFFFFTDNLVTYYIVSSGCSRSPELHRLIVEIKKLEQQLDIVLEVVHVPGTSLITQGTDGLSRGVWCSPLHDRPDQGAILESVFAPLPHSSQLTAWACCEARMSPQHHYHHVNWASGWEPSQVIKKHTIWTPPPEIAPQLLYDLLTSYTAAPLETSFLCVIP